MNSARSWALVVGSLVIVGFLFVPKNVVHAAALSPTSAVYQDLNTDGRVDNVKIVFADVSSCAYDADDWTVGVAGSVGITAVTGISNGGTCTTDHYLNLAVTATAGITGGETNPRIDYSDAGTAGSVVADCNQGGASFTATDGASPVVMSSDPPDGTSEIERTTPITLVFSEVVSSLSTTLTGGVVLTNAGLSSPTVVLSGSKVYGTNHLTVTAAPDASGNAFARFVASGNATTSFAVVLVVSATASVPSSGGTYAVLLSRPVAGETHGAGDEILIDWSTEESTRVVGVVNIAYSTDGGATYTAIANGAANTDRYAWTAPNINASVMVRVQASDLVNVLATATSGVFTIGTPPVSEDEASSADTADVAPEDSAVQQPEEQFIKGVSWSTIYSIDSVGKRRPFLDEQTFFTYEDTFENVVEVADADLAAYPIGEPMLPKAGVVLAKVVSLNNVYALEADNTLRWIMSESLAANMYGSHWADYVIDVPVTAWGHFTVGDDVTTSADIVVDPSILETREELNSR